MATREHLPRQFVDMLLWLLGDRRDGRHTNLTVRQKCPRGDVLWRVGWVAFRHRTLSRRTDSGSDRGRTHTYASVTVANLVNSGRETNPRVDPHAPENVSAGTPRKDSIP
jgi:hypothetical protein